MRLGLTFVLALALHLTLGWAWTILAGLAAGFWVVRGGWWVGSLGVGLAWLLLVGYNVAVAARATAQMAETVGGLLGNMPGAVVVGMTVLVGLLLGGLGGCIGTQLALLVRRVPRRVAA